jgi:hypothetical protein
MWIEYNNNPCHKRVGDCTVRAISTALNETWEKVYIDLAIYGFMHCDIMNSNACWGKYLKDKGFTQNIISNDFFDFYTVEDFCRDNPNGIFILALQSHVIAVIDGNYYDTWQSGREPVVYYFEKEI